MQPYYSADGSSQTESNGAGDGTADDKPPAPGSQQRISRLRATLVEVCMIGHRVVSAESRRSPQTTDGVDTINMFILL